uniref:Uncharacterized protein n=1 Tax=Cacopsylla melanoneura TaxID=428564 RepID=A0A8D8YU21_9HEMI
MASYFPHDVVIECDHYIHGHKLTPPPGNEPTAPWKMTVNSFMYVGVGNVAHTAHRLWLFACFLSLLSFLFLSVFLDMDLSFSSSSLYFTCEAAIRFLASTEQVRL